MPHAPPPACIDKTNAPTKVMRKIEVSGANPAIQSTPRNVRDSVYASVSTNHDGRGPFSLVHAENADP